MMGDVYVILRVVLAPMISRSIRLWCCIRLSLVAIHGTVPSAIDRAG
jgi:hypothetical protein